MRTEITTRVSGATNHARFCLVPARILVVSCAGKIAENAYIHTTTSNCRVDMKRKRSFGMFLYAHHHHHRIKLPRQPRVGRSCFCQMQAESGQEIALLRTFSHDAMSPGPCHFWLSISMRWSDVVLLEKVQIPMCRLPEDESRRCGEEEKRDDHSLNAHPPSMRSTTILSTSMWSLLFERPRVQYRL